MMIDWRWSASQHEESSFACCGVSLLPNITKMMRMIIINIVIFVIVIIDTKHQDGAEDYHH